MDVRFNTDRYLPLSSRRPGLITIQLDGASVPDLVFDASQQVGHWELERVLCKNLNPVDQPIFDMSETHEWMDY